MSARTRLWHWLALITPLAVVIAVFAFAATVLAGTDVDVPFGTRGTQPPVATCPPVEESEAATPARADVGPPYHGPGAVITDTARDQAVPGTIGVAEDLPDEWFGTGAELENEPLLLCEYLLATDPPSGAMCSYTGADLDLVTGRYRFVVLRSGSPGKVRAAFELRGEPGPAEACPTTVDAAQQHAPVVYPPKTGELMAKLQPLIDGSA